MSGSLFGKNFCISTFGESHGAGLGVVIDGCPSNIPISLEDIMQDMNRRKPGNGAIGTTRKEADQIKVLSGIFEGRTTGTPICLLIENTNQHSNDYTQIQSTYRPGHADYTFDQKYGFRDYRGGGRSSGRETAARVAAGAVAKRFLSELNIRVMAYTRSIGPVYIPDEALDLNQTFENPVSMPNAAYAKEALDYIAKMRQEQDSIGGIVECVATGLFPGIGEPVFDKLDARLAYGVMSIGGVKAFEIGSGIACSTMHGSEHNDAFIASDNGAVSKSSNHAGGTLGGISDGSDIFIRAHFKPTPSISKPQSTLDQHHAPTTIRIVGRHDPVIVPRAVVVVEAMVALILADLILSGLGSNINNIKSLLNAPH